MLTQEQNDLLTRVGPGTGMGELMRRYWHPVAAKAQLLEKKVMPVRILGEDLVLFVDKEGRVGLVGDRCAHRLVKLECGMTTEKGIQCPYHGWTFDTTGQCVDQPSEPSERFKNNVKIKSYPVEELAGLIFVYMGPLPAPLLPRWNRLVWDNVYRTIGIIKIPCNWLQCMENTPDPVHATYLHGQFFTDWMDKNGVDDPGMRRLAKGMSTPISKHEYEIGKYGIDRRWLFEGQDPSLGAWAEGLPLVFPHIHCTSGSGRHTFGWRLPIDDYNTLQVYVRVFEPGREVEVPEQDVVPYSEIEMVDKDGNFTALNSVSGQDVMAWVSQGPIMDRTKEILGNSDRGIVMYRQMLMQQVDVVRGGEDPINTFRDTTENQSIPLPSAADRGNNWGKGTDGSYIRGSVTAGDLMPQKIKDEIEDLFVRAAEIRANKHPISAE